MTKRGGARCHLHSPALAKPKLVIAISLTRRAGADVEVCLGSLRSSGDGGAMYERCIADERLRFGTAHAFRPGLTGAEPSRGPKEPQISCGKGASGETRVEVAIDCPEVSWVSQQSLCDVRRKEGCY